MGHSGIEIDHRGLTSETLRRFPNIYAPKAPAHVDPLEAESIDMIEHGLSRIALLFFTKSEMSAALKTAPIMSMHSALDAALPYGTTPSPTNPHLSRLSLTTPNLIHPTRMFLERRLVRGSRPRRRQQRSGQSCQGGQEQDNAVEEQADPPRRGIAL